MSLWMPRRIRIEPRASRSPPRSPLPRLNRCGPPPPIHFRRLPPALRMRLLASRTSRSRDRCLRPRMLSASSPQRRHRSIGRCPTGCDRDGDCDGIVRSFHGRTSDRDPACRERPAVGSGGGVGAGFRAGGRSRLGGAVSLAIRPGTHATADFAAGNRWGLRGHGIHR